MSKPQRTLEIRLGELRPVVDATELTRGLRGKLVGGNKRSARLVPAEGGMSIELLGSNTFVPISVGTLERELSVDARLLAGFLRNSTDAFHPAEIVGLYIGPDHLIGTCGTLKVTLMLGASPASRRKGRAETAAQTSRESRPIEDKGKDTPGEGDRRILRPPAKQPKEGEYIGGPTSPSGPTETDLRLQEAESALYRIEELDRVLMSTKRNSPDYGAIRFVTVGWFLLLAISELIFGGDALAWWVAFGSIGFFVEARSDRAAQIKWQMKRWKKEEEIAEIQKRIEMLGYSARKSPPTWVLQPKSQKTKPEARPSGNNEQSQSSGA